MSFMLPISIISKLSALELSMQLFIYFFNIDRIDAKNSVY
ncbi:hypothetical protein HMPREF9419_1312 [Prevotella nigrescens ATCC 33563]|nr:hypothetical protein HMPREF9419_1312 [Prevotella nigrescens ATCC 33563]